MIVCRASAGDHTGQVFAGDGPLRCADHSPCLENQQMTCRPVPGLHAGFDVGVDAPGGDPREVERC